MFVFVLMFLALVAIAVLGIFVGLKLMSKNKRRSINDV